MSEADLDLFEVTGAASLYCCACGVDIIANLSGLSIEYMIDEADAHRCGIVDLDTERERRGAGDE